MGRTIRFINEDIERSDLPPWGTFRRRFQISLFTVHFCGPTADLATKIAVAVIPDESNQPDQLERWFSDGIDIRQDTVIGERVSSFLRQLKVRLVAHGILGCLHEEGVDYPEGKSCPKCPYWAGGDRFAREPIL